MKRTKRDKGRAALTRTPTARAHEGCGSRELAAIALAAWRTAKRSQRSGDPAVVLPSVQFAATRLLEALETAGVQFLEYVGDSFDENLRVNVVEVKGSGARKRIVECLEPGVVVGGDLVHMASVVVAAQEER